MTAGGSRVRRAVGLMGARALGTGMNGIALILLARWLSPVGFGHFSVAWSILLTVSGVLALGLPVFALRSAVRGEVRATGFAIFLNLAMSVLATVVGACVAMLASGAPAVAVAGLALAVGFERSTEVRVALGMEFGRAGLVNAVLSVRGLAVVVVMVAGNALGVGPLASYVLGRLVAMAVSAVVLVRQVRGWPRVIRPPRDGTLEVLPPIAAYYAVGTARTLDVTVVGMAAGPLGAGLYSAALKLMTPLHLAASSVHLVLVGSIARGTAARVRRGLRALLLTTAAATVVLAAVSIWAETLVVLVLGDQYTGGGEVLRWFLLGTPASAAVGIVTTALQDKGAGRAAAVIGVVAVVLTLAGVWAGGQVAGAVGAAGAYAVVAWLQLVALFVAARLRLAASDAAA